MLPLTTNRMVEHQRQQAGDADHDALVERERVDLVLVGVGLPQIELRQLVGAQFGDEGDDGAGIERDAEDVGGGAFPAARDDRRSTGVMVAMRDRPRSGHSRPG